MARSWGKYLAVLRIRLSVSDNQALGAMAQVQGKPVSTLAREAIEALVQGRVITLGPYTEADGETWYFDSQNLGFHIKPGKGGLVPESWTPIAEVPA